MLQFVVRKRVFAGVEDRSGAADRIVPDIRLSNQHCLQLQNDFLPIHVMAAQLPFFRDFLL